jgi:hypothetical protein
MGKRKRSPDDEVSDGTRGDAAEVQQVVRSLVRDVEMAATVNTATVADALEASRQAEAEGLELKRSGGNATGFVGVTCSQGRFQASYTPSRHIIGGRHVQHLGMFSTAEGAALAIARARAADAARADEAAREAAAEAEAEAAAEGLTLERGHSVPGRAPASGYTGVTIKGKHAWGFGARLGDATLGTFGTAQEAALAVARARAAGSVVAADEEAAVRQVVRSLVRDVAEVAAAAAAKLARAKAVPVVPVDLEAAAAAALRQAERVLAEAEGLELEPAPRSNPTGYRGVHPPNGNNRLFRAVSDGTGGVRSQSLGGFNTAEEAALAVARARAAGTGPAVIDEAAAQKQRESAAAALRTAEAEGLQLKRSKKSTSTGFTGVSRSNGSNGRFQAKTSDAGVEKHLGIFDSPEEAALAVARARPALTATSDERESECAIVREHERPTRPRTAFSFYRRATREQVRVANAGLASGDVAKLQAAAWKELDAAGRTRWVAQAAADVARFEQEKKDHDERCLAAQAVAQTAAMAEAEAAAEADAAQYTRYSGS